MSSVRQLSGRPGFNPRSTHTKDSKMVLDAALLSTQDFKVRIKSKVEQSVNGVAPSSTPSVVAIEKGAFGSPSTKVANFTYLFCKATVVYLL